MSREDEEAKVKMAAEVAAESDCRRKDESGGGNGGGTAVYG